MKLDYDKIKMEMGQQPNGDVDEKRFNDAVDKALTVIELAIKRRYENDGDSFIDEFETMAKGLESCDTCFRPLFEQGIITSEQFEDHGGCP